MSFAPETSPARRRSLFPSLALLVGVLASAVAVAPPARAQTFETKAPFAILLDAQTGSVMFEKNADEQMAPSSMSKLMTAYMVFERLKDGSLSLTDQLPVSENAWRTGGSASGGSTMFLPLNSTASVEDLLRGIIIQSGNDACIVIAEGLAGDEDAFSRAMTRKSREIGLTASNFVNSTGLPNPEHYTTARDLATLARAIINNFPEYYHYYSETEFTHNGITQHNRNPLLYRNIGADGLKTGHTAAAGYGLTASAKQGNRRVIMVVNGLASIKERSEEAERLMSWAFRNFENVELFDAGVPLSQAEVWMGDRKTVPLVLNQRLQITLPRNATREMTMKVVYDGPLSAPVEKGTPVATLYLESPEMVTMSFPLLAGESVDKLGWAGRFGRTLTMMFDRMIGKVFSEPAPEAS